MTNVRWIVWGVLLFFIPSQLLGVFAINTFRPWDINLRPWVRYNKGFHLTGYDEIETGLKVFNAHGHKENSGQIWTETQDAIAMLEGFPAGSPETEYLQNVLLMPTDNGIRGHLVMRGDVHLAASAGVSFYYNAPYCIQLSAHLPLYAMSLKNVFFQDLTGNSTPEDVRVREFLTNDIAQTVHLFDPTLNLNGWSRTGIGDLALLGEWHGRFKQDKEYLKNVEILLRLCLILPTGLGRNEDDILSIPFGYEGTSLMFGGGITLTWWDFLRGGVDFEFFYTFGSNKTRRIKTQEDQTDFLLLAKAKTHKEFGITERYQLSLDTVPFCAGISLGVAYQFWRHSRDKLDLLTADFSNRIANTAESLQEWTMHQLIFKLWYNSAPDGCGEDFDTQILFFYKLPINGKRALLFDTIGAAVILSF